MDKFLHVVSTRLAKERKRLGLDQTEVCDAVDISIPTLSRYENGKRSPELAKCLALSELGYDMHYVLTGDYVSEQSSDLLPEEKTWLNLYRNAKNKKALTNMVKAFEQISHDD